MPAAPVPDTPRIAVFAKAPQAGAVKTRLVPKLGAEGAARLHAALVTHSLSTAVSAQPASLQLWCSPDAAHPFFAECSARFGCELRVQQGADLGARMAHAFEGNTPLVLLGTDCPALTPAHLDRAWRMLADHDAVFVPAEDGGYALVAMSRASASIFDDVAWGSDKVMRQTRERLAAAKLRWTELDTLWDVDRPEDYERLRASGLAAEIPA